MTRFLRYLWASPTTLLGLVVAFALLRRGRLALVDGVIEAHSPLLDRALASLTPLARGADAMTLGHVVLGRNARTLKLTRAHERVHVRQYEWWGPFFLPAYFLAGAWAFVRGRDPYFDNRFELEARTAGLKSCATSELEARMAGLKSCATAALEARTAGLKSCATSLE